MFNFNADSVLSEVFETKWNRCQFKLLVDPEGRQTSEEFFAPRKNGFYDKLLLRPEPC